MGFAGSLGVPIRVNLWARLGVAIGFGIAVELLLYAAPLGWLTAICVGALLTTIVGFGRVEALRSPAILLAGAGLLAVVVEPHWASLLLAFLGLTSVAIVGQANVARDAWRWVRSVVRFIVTMPRGLVSLLSGTSGKPELPDILSAFTAIVRQWIVPLSLASGFLVLFLIGNPLMADGMSSVLNFVFAGDDFSLVDFIATVLRIGIVALLCWPFLHTPDLQLAATVLGEVQEKVSLGTAFRTLVLCNLVFGLQNFLDLTVLWGGGMLPEDMTLSEYAHQGIYPLALAAILVGVFVLLALPAGGVAEKTHSTRWLTFLWLGQTFLLTASCLKRLDMYISAYSLTYMRTFAIVMTACIGVGLVWIFLRIAMRRSNRWLFTASTLTGLTFLFLGSVVDVGSRIAWFNVEHSREVGGEGVHLDVTYLRNAVGPSAIPALTWFLENRNTGIDQLRRTRVHDRPKIAQVALTQDFEKLMKDHRAWTLRRYWLQKEIARLD